MEEAASLAFERFMKTTMGRCLKAYGIDVLSYFSDLETTGVDFVDFWLGKYGEPDFSDDKEI